MRDEDRGGMGMRRGGDGERWVEVKYHKRVEVYVERWLDLLSRRKRGDF